jgi:hypothetical protein
VEEFVLIAEDWAPALVVIRLAFTQKKTPFLILPIIWLKYLNVRIGFGDSSNRGLRQGSAAAGLFFFFWGGGGVVGSNPAGHMEVCLLKVLCVVT